VIGKLLATVAVCAALGACAESAEDGDASSPAAPAAATAEPGEGAAVPVSADAAALVGAPLAAALGPADRDTLQRTTQAALDKGHPDQALPWRNPRTGNYGTVVTKASYQDADGRLCRAFQQTAIVGGQQEHSQANACRETDGTWRIEH
jgi:surface antigen